MERLSNVKHGKISQRFSKKRPVKVVYISNPMKVKTTPSEFRAVVQQLTGKYATSPQPYEFDTKVYKEEKEATYKKFTNGSDLSYADLIITPKML